MSVTYDEVRLARKRAYDRVDYWLQKYQGVTIHEAGISIPRIPKDLHPSEYGDWFDYFEGFTGAEEHGGTEDYVFDEYEPPDLDPEYHPEPEPPEEPDLPEEPEPPEPSEEPDFSDEPWWEDYEEDEEPEPEPSEPEPEEDEQTAPDPVDLEAEIRDNAYGIDHEAGQLIGEALDNIKEQFENIGDIEGYNSGLRDVLDDRYLWDSLQRANKYNRNGGTSDFGIVRNGIQVDAEKIEKANSELNHALQKLYSHFGMKYYREY